VSARVLVVANDHVGAKMAGPGIRSLRFASELAADHEVTLVVPFATDISAEGFEIVQDDPWDGRRMHRRVAGYDAVVAQKLPVSTMRELSRSETVAIYDLYAPLTIESIAWASLRPNSRRSAVIQRLNALTQEVTLACGDAFICASDKQRDLWLGALLALGRIDQSAYDADPSLRGLIDVVPFGIEPLPPVATQPVLKGVVPGIGPDDKVLLWGGGIWNWFDPLTVISAVHRLSQQHDNIRLCFLGLRHPNPGVPQMEMERRAVALAEELKLRDRVVFFNEGWVPYNERGSYFLEADLGVSAHFDDLETRFAYRTRLLDYFWAGLPTVTTRGDALADLIREDGLGRVVDVGNVEEWTREISELLTSDDERADIKQRLVAVRARLLWPRVVEPLRRLLVTTRAGHSRVPVTTVMSYARRRVENAVLQRGVGNTAATAARSVMRRTRPLEERVQPPVP
jgi:glycosyltransferase involved in cell wall biosynthesis